ncbi:HPP family protein [Bacillus sp. FSL R5-0677]|uniref:HPP family protein n=1 Tax=Bacillus sp. FSL R5-0677 TaxID=2921581 RepID=UPI0030F8EE06
MDNITTAKQKEAQPISVRYFAKMKGKGRSPLQVNIKDSLTSITSTELLMAPFGASCVLAFGVWNAPLSQPRNIIGGHLISTFIGLSIYHLFGNEYWTIALAVGMSIAIMMLTRTTHPPAGADPIVVILGAYSWSYLVTPVLVGSLVIVVIALFINNMSSKRNYPTFWI